MARGTSYSRSGRAEREEEEAASEHFGFRFDKLQTAANKGIV